MEKTWSIQSRDPTNLSGFCPYFYFRTKQRKPNFPLKINHTEYATSNWTPYGDTFQWQQPPKSSLFTLKPSDYSSCLWISPKSKWWWTTFLLSKLWRSTVLSPPTDSLHFFEAVGLLCLQHNMKHFELFLP